MRILNRIVPAKPNGAKFLIYSILTAFLTYSCMYGLRRAYTAATFDDLTAFGFDYKILLILLQGFGYLLSKFIGIKVVSEMGKANRGLAIIILTGIAGVALVLFAILPPPYNALLMLLNGLPLGMIWGLVFSYLEGRRSTELLGAGLCVSFILSSGFVKTVGHFVMHGWGASEFWMPAITGGMFFIPLVVLVIFLNRIPEPSVEDIEARSERTPMSGSDRMQMFKAFASGLVLLVVVYTLLTVLRDYRDNFIADIWVAVGYGNHSSIFTYTEIIVAFGVLIFMGLVMYVRSNSKALMLNHAMVAAGLLCVFGSTILYEYGILGAPAWIVLAGFGLYLGYVPFNAFLFERLLATFRNAGNACFLIYLADSFGYLGSFGTLIYKNFFYMDTSPLDFFISMCYWVGGVGSLLIFVSGLYFWWRARGTRIAVL